MVDAAAMQGGGENMLFIIVGDGADRARIQKRAWELGLSNLRFLPLLDEDDFRGLLSASDVCLVTQQKTASEIAFPSKIVTYLAAGCPVIASVSQESEVARIIKESGAGVVTEAEDGAALLRAIKGFRTADLQEMAKSARAFAIRRWSADRVMRNFECAVMRAAFPVSNLSPEEILR